MRRILFVDDEPRLLDGLRRSLRPLRQEWAMEFVSTGKAALEILAQSGFDVIVSDLRMPEMDGSQLLTEVRRRFPRMVRILLTGETERESVVLGLRVAHQRLTK